MTACYCGSEHSYAECCQPVHQGQPAATPELLMRSRYSAFAIGDDAYLQRSWHPSTRPSAIQSADNTQWLKLEILSAPKPAGNSGTVHFRAFCKEADGSLAMLEEVSRFSLVNGQWLYLDGDTDYHRLS
ncbi:YchJ family protein [Aliidiomarina soli]|uniref:YchJ-like middle NTF2-like domain-containing protein n=1 Tax=Aliidiomarina soli TaxID=1928574 RepID=A0A432WHX2_9GAMM|nr:YchJ family metal-binding protein [Aliidiomarina soli]RUO33353.1 hypothetical protein CWE14_09075 [Aliidiomarina soli]